jgi:signal peptidase II
LRVLYVTLFAVVLDQLTKFFVKGLKIESLGISIPGMPYGSSKQVFGNIVKLTFIENPGMAFGIDIGPKMFLTIFTIGASLLILYYIFKHRHDGVLIRLSLAFILAGALGNLIDRTFYGLIYGYAPLFHGRVVDFVQVEFWDFTIFGKTYTTWPIFNVADVSVTLGFLIILFFHKKIFKEEHEVTGAAEGSSLPLGDTDKDVSASGEQNVLNNNGSEISFEDTKGNPAQGTAGTEEAQDR